MNNYTKTLLALKGKRYALVTLSLFSIVTIIWTIINIFATQTTQVVEDNIIKATKPLKANLNQEALQLIQTKNEISSYELGNLKVRAFEVDPESRSNRIIIIDN